MKSCDVCGRCDVGAERTREGVCPWCLDAGAAFRDAWTRDLERGGYDGAVSVAIVSTRLDVGAPAA
jgi:hypothetical protein